MTPGPVFFPLQMLQLVSESTGAVSKHLTVRSAPHSAAKEGTLGLPWPFQLVARSGRGERGWGINKIYTSPRGAVTNHHAVGDLKQQKFLLFQFWRREVNSQAVRWVGSVWRLDGISAPSVLPSFWWSQQPLAFPGLQTHDYHLCFCQHMAFSPCLSVHIPFFSQGHQSLD